MRVSNMPTNTIFQKLLVLFFFVFGTQFFAQDSIATPSTFQVENGKTIILSTTATNPKPIKINQKTYTWIPHPSDKSQKIAILSIPYRTPASTITLENGSIVQNYCGKLHQRANPSKPQQSQTQSQKSRKNPKRT